MVLLRTSAVFQPHRRAPISDTPRITQACTRHDQSAVGAVRRLAYEASECGLLSAELAAGIRRVEGVKKIGVRLGNWLMPDQAVGLLEIITRSKQLVRE
jgi:hypothetical protein